MYEHCNGAFANGPKKWKITTMRHYNVGALFEEFAIDVNGPFPSTEYGNKYKLVTMDYSIKWVKAYIHTNQEDGRALLATLADVLVK